MARVEERSSPRLESTDEQVLKALLDGLRSLGKSCRGMSKRKGVDALIYHNPRIRIGDSLAYLMFESLREDEGVKLIVRGVAYEPLWVTSSGELHAR